MKLLLPKETGFCFGVKNALRIASAQAGKPDVATYGALIHNKSVTESLQEKGIRIAYDLETVLGGSLIIRSHGAGKDVFEAMHEKGVEVIDATCPFVKIIHEIVREHYEKGYHICIIGSARHPEVIGINGWCGYRADIIEEDFDFARLQSFEKLCIVVQTTYSEQKYSEIIKKIQKLCLKTVEIFDTICYTTKERQHVAAGIAAASNVVLVIGSKESSNTTKLYELCHKLCSRTFHIERTSGVQSIKFNPEDTVGILAGASTPMELVMEVCNYMSQNFEEVQNQEFISGVEESLVSYREGKRVKGTVLSADENGIKVNIGGKKDGLIPRDEISIDGSYDPEDYKPETEIEAIITSKNDSESGCLLLSKKKVDLIKEGDKIVDTIRDGEEFELAIDRETKGGLLAKLGTYTVFVPGSQVKERFVRDLKPFVGKKLRLVALEIDDTKHKIVASQRKILERERKEKEETFWTYVQPNVVVSGTVKRITNFGAFVSVAGFDCLAHIVDISWNHVKNIEEILKIGQNYDFLVLSADREKNRVSLGYKQLQPHPFVAAMAKYPVGSVVKGKVVNIVPYGAFVEIEKGIEGLVHVSETAHAFVKDINEILKVGDEVDVKIINIDEPSRKITLSIKACLPQDEMPQRSESEDREERDGGDKKPSRGRKTDRKPRDNDDAQKEWNEEASHNPFADLLKDLEFSDNK